jgi:hypothetical protein
VTLDAPLSHNTHGGWAEYPAALPVANMTCSVKFECPQGAAHMMQMHAGNVRITDASFTGFGRTRFDSDHSNIPGEPNQMGRYVIHLHKFGAGWNRPTIVEVARNVVRGSPKHGIVNHQSHADIHDNVVLDCKGSGIFAENGTESGFIRHNLAIRCTNNAAQVDDTRLVSLTPKGVPGDFGADGVGIWAQGGNVDLVDNVCLYCRTGVETFPQLLLGGEPSYMPAEQLRPDERDVVARGQTMVSNEHVPSRILRNTVLFAGEAGISFWATVTSETGYAKCEDNLMGWCSKAIAATYSEGIAIRNNRQRPVGPFRR